MADFFIADMHFGSPYRSYAQPRGFASVAEMHDAITQIWRSYIDPNDTVWVLGDVGDVEPLRDLPGTKRLIFGNSDRPKSAYKDSGAFSSHNDWHILETAWKPILLVHHPRDAKRSDVHVLHGHTHAEPDERDTRFLSVSVDKTGWGPISLDEVICRFQARAATR